MQNFNKSKTLRIKFWETKWTPFDWPQALYWINKITDEFDVILILEELDLSLAVLALKFCWEVEDVVHFKLNSMVTKTPRRPLSAEATKKLKDFNWPDEYLYRFWLI